MELLRLFPSDLLELDLDHMALPHRLPLSVTHLM